MKKRYQAPFVNAKYKVKIRRTSIRIIMLLSFFRDVTKRTTMLRSGRGWLLKAGGKV